MIKPLGFLVAIAASSLAAPGQALAQGWPGYAHDPQHSCLAVAGSQLPETIRWSTPVDAQYANNNGGTIYVHYGSPVITRVNTVIVPVQTSPNGGSYSVKAINGKTGTTIWSASSDYTLPKHDWVPIFGVTLTPKDRYLAYPGPGGTIYVRSFPDSTLGTTSQHAFVNGATPVDGAVDNYSMHKAAFDASIQVCTPISSDALGNLYFGFISNGSAPGMNGIDGGLAKISNTGVGSFVAASLITPDPSMQKVAYNCAPSFNADGSTVYVAINNSSGKGYLCALSTATLATKSYALCLDPSNNAPAVVDDDGSATPTVGPDGDVYYGVLASNISGNHLRGYLLHFDGILSTLPVPKTPSAFGWDDTASIVPASAVPQYSGTSSYLLLTKYNNYADYGLGDGVNRLAVVDPNASMVDPISGVKVMKPAITVTGVTKDTNFPNLPNAVREWCINSAAIDVVNKCAVVNSEDGHIYRWDFASNTLVTNPGQSKPGLYLEPSTSEAYTPTVIGPDGAAYAINNARLFCCGVK